MMLGKVILRLFCHDAVRALIEREKDVADQIKCFAEERAPSSFRVAGPPLPEEIKRYRDTRPDKIELPAVFLRCERVRHHLTGAMAIKVTCSDEDIEELRRWNREAPTMTRHQRRRLIDA